MSEEDAKLYKDAEKIEHSLEVRQLLGWTGSFMRSPPKS